MIIGLSAAARHGKDTVARLLVERHGFVETSFAEPLREFTAQVLGISLDTLELVKEKPIPELNNITPRQFMQQCGTEFGRDSIHPELWIISAHRRIQHHVSAGTPVVISDVRFPNEAQSIIDAGGHIVRIDRPNAATTQYNSHQSEQFSDDMKALVSYEIVNDGGLDDLEESVELVVAQMRADVNA